MRSEIEVGATGRPRAYDRVGLTLEERRRIVAIGPRAAIVRALGVSEQTVSELWSIGGRVSPATLARIRARLAELEGT